MHHSLTPPLKPPPPANCIRAPQLSDYGHKRDRMKTERARWEITRLGLLWAARCEHTQKISQPTVSLLRVCDSVIVLHPTKGRMEESPRAQSHWLLLLLPGKQGFLGLIKDLLALLGRTLSCVYIFPALFEGKTKQNCRCSFAIILANSRSY